MSSTVSQTPLNTTPGAGRARLKQLAIGALLVGLGAVAATAMVRESRQPAAPAEVVGNAFTGNQQRPAFSAAEESYAAALWPVHEQVKSNAVKMTFTGLSYKMGEIDRTSVKNRVSPLAKAFREAYGTAAKLKVPTSLQPQHQIYLSALKQYQSASEEMARIAGDGKDEHLIAAQKLSFAASEELLRVGDVLWPGEFKPN
jgi:hypothetical protein